MHGWKTLLDAPVGFTALRDCGQKLAIDQLDAVIGDSNTAQIYNLVLAVVEIIVSCDICTIVTDVAEIGAHGPIIIE